MRITNNARIRHDSPNPPLGVRFRPDDLQLIRYLIKFVASNNFVCKDIQFEDLYGSKKPWELIENSSDTKYFFTQLKKKKSDHTNFVRTLDGGGSWKGLSKGKLIGKFGLKKTYNYKQNTKDSVSWIMKEYSLDEKVIKSLRNRGLMKHEDVVLCFIKSRVKDKDHMPTRTDTENDDDDDVLTTPQQNELQQDQNREQVMNQVQNIGIQTSQLENYNVHVPSTITNKMMNNMATHTQPQWPICTDESGNGYQPPQQNVTCPMDQGSSFMFNEGSSNAEFVVPDEWAACLEQTTTIASQSEYHVEPTSAATTKSIFMDPLFKWTSDFLMSD